MMKPQVILLLIILLGGSRCSSESAGEGQFDAVVEKPRVQVRLGEVANLSCNSGGTPLILCLWQMRDSVLSMEINVTKQRKNDILADGFARGGVLAGETLENGHCNLMIEGVEEIHITSWQCTLIGNDTRIFKGFVDLCTGTSGTGCLSDTDKSQDQEIFLNQNKTQSTMGNDTENENDLPDSPIVKPLIIQDIQSNNNTTTMESTKPNQSQNMTQTQTSTTSSTTNPGSGLIFDQNKFNISSSLLDMGSQINTFPDEDEAEDFLEQDVEKLSKNSTNQANPTGTGMKNSTTNLMDIFQNIANDFQMTNNSNFNLVNFENDKNAEQITSISEEIADLKISPVVSPMYMTLKMNNSLVSQGSSSSNETKSNSTTIKIKPINSITTLPLFISNPNSTNISSMNINSTTDSMSMTNDMKTSPLFISNSTNISSSNSSSMTNNGMKTNVSTPEMNEIKVDYVLKGGGALKPSDLLKNDTENVSSSSTSTSSTANQSEMIKSTTMSSSVEDLPMISTTDSITSTSIGNSEMSSNFNPLGNLTFGEIKLAWFRNMTTTTTISSPTDMSMPSSTEKMSNEMSTLSTTGNMDEMSTLTTEKMSPRPKPPTTPEPDHMTDYEGISGIYPYPLPTDMDKDSVLTSSSSGQQESKDYVELIMLNRTEELNIGTFIKSWNGWRYKFETIEKVPWIKAFQNCKKSGQELVSIDSDAEYEFLEKMIENLSIDLVWNSSWWTSGTSKFSDDGTFFWMGSGEKVGAKYWGTGEPNGMGKEPCIAVIYRDYYKGFKLNDIRCEVKSNYVCKSKLGINLPL